MRIIKRILKKKNSTQDCMFTSEGFGKMGGGGGGGRHIFTHKTATLASVCVCVCVCVCVESS